ncbi:MAG: 4Fe-4S dicluster domain-containing protein [Pirellulaceae bacterium]|nr:4Fe-4S dicluster domain-containing protein [Pirellulaceae bacterium]
MPDANVSSDAAFLEKAELNQLIRILRESGYRVVGPKIEQNAIVYAELESANDLPIGWSDAQEPGIYRLRRNDTESYFAYNVGPHSWKQFLFPPRITVATADRTEDGWQMDVPEDNVRMFAFLGVRACELKAIAIQDRVFMGGAYVDPIYQKRREAALIIAVNCTQAAKTCFCTSMNSGPRCLDGYDLALTEFFNGFEVEVGSAAGAAVLKKLAHRPATLDESSTAAKERSRAIDQISKHMSTEGIRDLLLKNLEHPRWDQVAERCLSCANCTMVCPTCFCSTVSEVADLQGDHVERLRTWDSCFNLDFSYIAGGIVRNDRRSRYRQWLTHKLASWQDQFDSSGCVGCGRCIAWCPVGIDLTEEVAAIRNEPSENRTLPVIQPSDSRVCGISRVPVAPSTDPPPIQPNDPRLDRSERNPS